MGEENKEQWFRPTHRQVGARQLLDKLATTIDVESWPPVGYVGLERAKLVGLTGNAEFTDPETGEVIEHVVAFDLGTDLIIRFACDDEGKPVVEGDHVREIWETRPFVLHDRSREGSWPSKGAEG